MERKGYLTTKDVARLLRVTDGTVRYWSQRGALRAEVTPGGHRRFLRTDLEAFARARGVDLEQSSPATTRVLVVDDNAEFARYLRELLYESLQPLEVRVAADGFAAGHSVVRFRPTIILLDIRMPHMDGFEVCRTLKQDPDTRDIRIIAMTGYYTEEVASRIVSVGAETCLEKPVDVEGLWRAMRLAPSDSPIPESDPHSATAE